MGDFLSDVTDVLGSVIPGVGAVVNAIQTGDNNRENREFTASQNAIARDFAREQTSVNLREAAVQREFQERMSSTSHQRAMRDLEAAGLNPILAAQQGAPMATGAAASAAGASHHNSQGQSQRLGDALSSVSSSALQVMQMRKQFEQADAGIDVDKAKTLATIAEADKNAVTATGQRLTNQILRKQMPVISAEAEKNVGQASWDKSLQGFDNILRRASDVGGTILDLVNPINAVRRGLDYKYQRPQQPGVPYPPGSPGRHSYMDRKK